MKKILVTGSNGLLGQTLTQLISSTSRAELVASSKGPNRYPVSEGYQYADLDICDKKQILEVVSYYKPNVIIHTAAVTNADICHTERNLCWELNVEAVKHLVEICQDKDIHLIYLSTDFVFDGKAGPYSEEIPPSPISYYGESKYEAEKVIQNSSCKWAILRTSLVYGITANISRSNIILWAKSALEKGDPINVVTDQWRMPTFVDDLAEACLLAAEKEATGIFHTSGKDMMTIFDLVSRVADFYSLDKSLIKPVTSQSLNQEAKRPLKTGFILNKAINVLGYNPHSFFEGMKKMEKQFVAMQQVYSSK